MKIHINFSQQFKFKSFVYLQSFIKFKKQSMIKQLTKNEKDNTTQLNLSNTVPLKIDIIQGLDRFTNLKCLILSNNAITAIQGIDHLKQLKVLNLQFNQIQVVQNLQNLHKLQQLFLSYNNISQISINIQENKNLKVLHLAYNEIQNIETITPIFVLNKIVILSVYGNPFLNSLNYFSFIKMLMPQLLILDDKDINNVQQQPQLNPQQEVVLLRDTLNKLLQERNYLAQQLTNLSLIQQHNSPQRKSKQKKVKIKKFIQSNHHFQSQNYQPQPQNQNENISINSSNSKAEPMTSNITSQLQKEKIIQILSYWQKKMKQKISKKKVQIQQLQEYYTNKLKYNKKTNKSVQDRFHNESLNAEWNQSNQENIVEKQKQKQIKTREILQDMKIKQAQYENLKNKLKNIRTLNTELASINSSLLYKSLMFKILFGTSQANSSVKYKELKQFLIFPKGVVSVLTQLYLLVFGQTQIDLNKIDQLKEFCKEKSLIQIANDSKKQKNIQKKQNKKFQQEQKLFLKKFQIQTEKLCQEWQNFNKEKKQFQLQRKKHKKIDEQIYEQKMKELQQRMCQEENKQSQKVQKLKKQAKQYESYIEELQQQQNQLEQMYQRKYKQLEEFQIYFQELKEQKKNVSEMNAQIVQVKRQLFAKENILSETNEKLKQLAINQEINSQRVKFLERKCYEKSEQIKQLEESYKKVTQKLRLKTQQLKLKNLQFERIQQKFEQFTEQEQNLQKTIERLKGNLKLYEQKLKNMTEIQQSKKVAIKSLELRIQQQKQEFVKLNQKNLQLQQILIEKQQKVNVYTLKVAQHKKNLESLSNINEQISDMMQRQSQLKKSILQLQIENGNLLDLKNQLVRDLKKFDIHHSY